MGAFIAIFSDNSGLLFRVTFRFEGLVCCTYRWIVRELITMGTPCLVAKLHKRSMRTRITMACSSDRPAFTEIYTKYAWIGIDGTAVLWNAEIGIGHAYILPSIW